MAVRITRAGWRNTQRPHHPTRRPRRAGARSATVVLAGLALILSGLVSPAVAQTRAGAKGTPHLARTPRGDAARTVGRGVVVNAGDAARTAVGLPRRASGLARRTVDLGARPSTTAIAPKDRLVRSGAASRTGSTLAPTPKIVVDPLDPKVTTAFPGITEAGTCSCEPPDPWVAVGPTHVVQSTNGMIRISNRLGAQLVSMPAWALFAVPADRADADPRILWDAVHARWVGVITTFNDPDFTTNGLRLAVSETADPTGAWIVYPIETDNFLPDYPGISSSSDKIILSSDDFLNGADFDGPTIYVIDWANVLAGTSLFVGTAFYDSTQAHFRPAQMLSSASRVPVIFEIGGAPAVPGYLEVAGPAHTFSVENAHDLNFMLGAAPLTEPSVQPVQPGDVAIASAADERPSDAVYRSGHVWFAATGDYFDGTDHWSAARWTEVLTPNNGTGPTAANDWITADSVHYFMPGIGISGNGTAFLVTTGTTSTEFPTTVVASVQLSATTSSPWLVLEASTEAYIGSRWGDYVGVAADPSAYGAVWVAHELVASGGGWRTSVARVVSDNTAPGAPGVVSQAIVAGSTLGATVPVRTSWLAAADAGSGIRSYLVERSDDSGPYVGVQTSSTSVTQALTVNHTYRYRITAIDAVGNIGAPTYGPLYRPTLYQSTSGTVVTGTWGSQTNTGFSGGSTRYASTAGASATFTITAARSIAIVSTKATSRGSFKVYVDNVYKGTISTYLTSSKFRQIVYQYAWATPGTHKVKLVVSGTSGHPRIDADAFVVLR